ncbi:hypothetical protein BGW42_001244 [Actinomortierella wolfii]|nr:hypothetical protein BGW42_001244 [Actinomortierella wolfii]
MRGMRSIQLYLHDVPCRSEENSTPSETESSGVYKDTFSMDIDLAYEFLRRWNAAATNAIASIPSGSNCQRRGASTVITLINQDRLSFSLFSDQHYSAELRRAMCMLPKSFLPMILLDDEPSWYRFAWFPETIDLSHVLEIDGVGPIDSVMNPSAAVATPRPWPSQGKAAVIQQCRSLEYLTLSLEPGDQNSAQPY